MAGAAAAIGVFGGAFLLAATGFGTLAGTALALLAVPLVLVSARRERRREIDGASV